MKSIRLILLLLPFTTGLSPVMAQTFDQANSLYDDGQYADAAAMYQQLIDGKISTSKGQATLYYNMGNAYFRLGELSQAILSYERSLRLNPNLRDARYNLALAQARITDNITDNRTFFLSSLLMRIRDQLQEPVWRWMSIIAFSLALVLLLLWVMASLPAIRKAAFYSAIVCLIVSICALADSASLHRRDTLRAEAIITQGIVNAKAAPDRSGTELFTLHEGTKVFIRETLGEWCNIRVGNNEGWIPARTLERI